MSQKQPITEAQAKQSFQDQLSESNERSFPPLSAKTADDLLKIPLSVKEILVVDIYVDEFIKQHPQLEGARNMPNIRKAVLTDLKTRGIL
jgi:hypothetical protein